MLPNQFYTSGAKMFGRGRRGRAARTTFPPGSYTIVKMDQDAMEIRSDDGRFSEAGQFSR
jgi:hypothetical protein